MPAGAAAGLQWPMQRQPSGVAATSLFARQERPKRPASWDDVVPMPNKRARTVASQAPTEAPQTSASLRQRLSALGYDDAMVRDLGPQASQTLCAHSPSLQAAGFSAEQLTSLVGTVHGATKMVALDQFLPSLLRSGFTALQAFEMALAANDAGATFASLCANATRFAAAGMDPSRLAGFVCHPRGGLQGVQVLGNLLSALRTQALSFVQASQLYLQELGFFRLKCAIAHAPGLAQQGYTAEQTLAFAAEPRESNNVLWTLVARQEAELLGRGATARPTAPLASNATSLAPATTRAVVTAAVPAASAAAATGPGSVGRVAPERSAAQAGSDVAGLATPTPQPPPAVPYGVALRALGFSAAQLQALATMDAAESRLAALAGAAKALLARGFTTADLATVASSVAPKKTLAAIYDCSNVMIDRGFARADLVRLALCPGGSVALRAASRLHPTAQRVGLTCGELAAIVQHAAGASIIEALGRGPITLAALHLRPDELAAFAQQQLNARVLSDHAQAPSALRRRGFSIQQICAMSRQSARKFARLMEQIGSFVAAGLTPAQVTRLVCSAPGVATMDAVAKWGQPMAALGFTGDLLVQYASLHETAPHYDVLAKHSDAIVSKGLSVGVLTYLLRHFGNEPRQKFTEALLAYVA